MANVYTNLGMLKDGGTLGATTSTNDTQLLRIAEEASRMIDKYCDRYFFIYEGTWYEDGAATRLILNTDVQSITTLKSDPDGDGVYDTTYNLTSTPVDAHIYPQNITPKTRLEINPWGSIGHFAAGVRNGIQIVGVFGYGADWPSSYVHAASATVNSALTSTSNTLDIATNSTGEISGGMTLRIGSEQLFVNAQPTGTNNSTASVTRAVNGTTANSASSTSAISIYDYPAAIVQATVIQTIRTWKRRESGYVNTIINTDMGNVQVFKGLDPDVKETINNYKRMRVPRWIQ